MVRRESPCSAFHHDENCRKLMTPVPYLRGGHGLQ
jgi:hypothetical protein